MTKTRTAFSTRKVCDTYFIVYPYFYKLTVHLSSVKIQQKYNHLPGEPILIRLENVPPGGLGLSLAAEPIEEGNTDIKSMVIVDIKSSSQAHLKVGDEILEVTILSHNFNF
jgi:hypothetical protein